MKKRLSCWMMGCFLTASIQTYSQIGIGTTSVESNLLLKVNSTNKGILIPNLTFPNANSPIPVTNPAVGLVAYNNYSGKKDFNYWDGSKWSELVDFKNVSSFLGINQTYRVSNTSVVDLIPFKVRSIMLRILFQVRFELPFRECQKILPLRKQIIPYL